MDPNENLREQLAICEAFTDGKMSKIERTNAFDRLVTLVEALHEWVIRGGGLPAAWEKRGEQP